MKIFIWLEKFICLEKFLNFCSNSEILLTHIGFPTEISVHFSSVSSRIYIRCRCVTDVNVSAEKQDSSFILIKSLHSETTSENWFNFIARRMRKFCKIFSRFCFCFFIPELNHENNKRTKKRKSENELMRLPASVQRPSIIDRSNYWLA